MENTELKNNVDSLDVLINFNAIGRNNRIIKMFKNTDILIFQKSGGCQHPIFQIMA